GVEPGSAPERARGRPRGSPAFRSVSSAGSYLLGDPQRPIARWREPERRFERASEVRLIGEPGIARYLHQRPLLVDALAREAETSHEQIAVGARAEHDPELPGQIVARQPGDRLQLRRMHDARSLRLEELPRALDRGNVDAPPRGRRS